MGFQAEYKKKLVTAEEAVKCVKSGDWVSYAWGCSTPYDLDKALAARASELTDVKIRNGISLAMPEIMKADDAGDHFTWHTWHAGGIDRKIIAKGCGYFQPMRYCELPTFYSRGYIYDDVLMLQTTPMDKFGNFNFGLSCSQLAASIKTAKKVIVEVNENMPWVFGLNGTEVNIADVDYVVEGSNPPVFSLPPAGEASEVDNIIADMIVEQIPNGACLQLGIGNMPNAIGNKIAESDLKDLGIHTEMYVDAFVNMSKAGKITGKYKELDPGRQLLAFAAGTPDMYEFCDRNPDVMAAPVDYTNDPYVIGQLSNFISINNAIEINLFGEVSAESVGYKHISGTGGQLDFMMGAYLSKGGKSFIALSSSLENKDGTLKSRIVPKFAEGTITTDPRSCVMYVCTEYGMVNLKGLPTWQKSEAIISLAHPQFRDELIADAEKAGIWRRSNKR